ncbi:NifB/NifX family molybdenum-iron cluster-binding protein [Xanthobacter agilis]|jgi:nitrogen fixation protein NifX|uniref:Nitrogen fixation protein NifX n=1 Tax=Xanthobacter agilis TaxID=47492 RepID=A0ABU0LDJ4_XANAG|nr:NifB/NifX family molybdenum-iron cluster-binding protein [Xanthobacter agilis]MDQ0505125.1 nitrogen fixation protein NifX [Xanthobacter agilis]
MLKVAFASNDQTTVNLHFGGAESLVLYDVAPGRADLIGVGAFLRADQVGESGRAGLTGTVQDKVLAKLDFLEGCHAVYAASIGTSSIRRLMGVGIQPIIVDTGHDIVDLLNEVSLALVYGGLAWVEKARLKAQAPTVSVPPAAGIAGQSHRLVSSLEELE